METFRWVAIFGIICIAAGIGLILCMGGKYENSLPIIGWVLIAIGLFITLFLLTVAFWSIPVLF